MQVNFKDVLIMVHYTCVMNRITNFVRRHVFKKEHNFSVTGTFSVTRYNSWKARVQVGYAIQSRYEKCNFLCE
jgi:hypothetical protein